MSIYIIFILFCILICFSQLSVYKYFFVIDNINCLYSRKNKDSEKLFKQDNINQINSLKQDQK